MLLSIVLFLLVGALAGWLAGVIVRGAGFGVIGNIVIGIIGALVGGFVFNLFGLDPSYGFWGSLLTATVGAVIFMVIVVLIKRA